MNLRLPSLPDKQALSRTVHELLRNLLVLYLILLITNYLLLPGYVELYFDVNYLLYMIAGCVYISFVLYVRDLETTDVRYEKLNKSVSYAFFGLLLVIAVQSNSLWILPENLKTPVLLAAIAFGAATLFLHRAGQFSFIHNKKKFKEIYEAGYDGIYKSISYAFYGLLIVTVLYYLPWIVLEGLKGPIMDAAIFFGALTFYQNRMQLISSVLYLRDLETTDVRYERLNKSVSYAFLGLLLVVVVQSNLSLLSESLKTPVILAAIGFGAATLYLHRVELVSFIMHPRKFEKNEIRYKGINKSISYAFYGLLIVVVLYYLPWTMLEELKTQIMVVAVALGALTFYLNRDKLGDVEEETRQEEEGEKRREMEFAGKYPRFDRVWGVRWFVKWMYKEGWRYSGGLIGLIFIGTVIRIYNLGYHNLWGDEGYTILAVEGIINTGYPTFDSGLIYPRALSYSYSLSAFSKIFGISEFSIRFFSVIFWILTVLIVYLLSKKFFGSKIAIMAVFIISFSIMSIEFSRYARFYQFTQFFFILSFFIYYKFIKNPTSINLLSLILSILFLVSSDLSGLIIIPLMIIIGIIYFADIINSYKKLIIIPLAVLFSTLLSGLFLYLDRYSFYNYHEKLIDSPLLKNSTTIEGIINIPIRFDILLYVTNLITWFKFEFFIFLIFVILTVIAYLRCFKSQRNKNQLILIISIISFIIFISLFTPKLMPRYFYLMWPMLIVVVSYSILTIPKIMKIPDTIRIAFIMIIVFALIYPVISYNIKKDFGPIEDTTYLPSPVLDRAQDYEMTAQFIKKNSEDGDIIIGATRGTFYYYSKKLDYVIYSKRFEKSLQSIPLNLYLKKDKYLLGGDIFSLNTLKNVNILNENGINNNSIFIDSVTGAIIIKEDFPYSIFTTYDRIWIIASRYDYHPRYTSKEYRKFLQNRDRIVFTGRDNFTCVYLISDFGSNI